MTKELLIVVLSVTMMIMVPARTGGQTKGNNILGSPWEVKSTVQFRQEESDNTIVDRSGDWMCLEEVQSDYGHPYLEYFFKSR